MSKMNKTGDVLSKEKQITKIFAQIGGIADQETGTTIPGTGIAEPGDLLFFITHHPDKQSFYKNKPRILENLIKSPLQQIFRECYGLSKNGFDEWHVAVYLRGRKRKRHKRINIWMIHSIRSARTGRGGVKIQHLSPTAILRRPTNSLTRLEILQFKGISQEQRIQITDFVLSKVGCNFDCFIRRYAMLTLVFGLPNFLHDRRLFACQSLVVCAYYAAGIYFPHPSNLFPLCNIGKYLGRPLGHLKDRVNPKYPYLMDHHIYRDPRFEVKAVVDIDQRTKGLKLKTENIEKFSWNNKLRDRYLAESSY